MPQQDQHDRPIHITFDLAGLAPIVAILVNQKTELRQILNELKELKAMSGQALTDLAAQRAVIDDLATSFATFTTNNDATLQALKDQIAAGGGTVDPAIDQAIVANTAALQSTLTTLHARLGTAPTP